MFLQGLEEQGFTWNNGQKFTNQTNYNEYGTKTCYMIADLQDKKIQYSDKEYYERYKYKIFTYDEIFVGENIKLDWNKILEENSCIQCFNEEQAKFLLEESNKKNFRWNDGENFRFRTNWDVYKGNTCYFIAEGFYANLNDVKKDCNIKNIYPFESILLDYKTNDRYLKDKIKFKKLDI